MANLLQIKNLSVNVKDKQVLDNINLEINKGEIHVLMGPNGSGKSTLMNSIMANPAYTITSGQIFFEGEDITELSTDKRAKKGIFMSFQNPKEIEGVNVNDFIRQAMQAQEKEYGGILKYNKNLSSTMQNLNMDKDYATRYVNVGFSGGEKKKTEILQMKMLDPSLALLDETDSGLDVDAVKLVAKSIEEFMKEDKAIMIITHHQEIISNLDPDFVHILKDGKIVKTGDKTLIEKIEKDGYQWLG